MCEVYRFVLVWLLFYSFLAGYPCVPFLLHLLGFSGFNFFNLVIPSSKQIPSTELTCPTIRKRKIIFKKMPYDRIC